MATISFRFTPQEPNALFGTSVLRFDKLIVNKGHMQDLEFLIMWKTKEDGKIISHSLSFQPPGFVEKYMTTSHGFLYEFRKENTAPVYQLGENMGVELVAHHANGGFDCALSLEIDPV